ncbi:hypothetical protein AWB80_06216 [Caballeronia pedi]|uniref:Lipoprotein n=1 Tax=Caballeronia pedi TaxID=1777141 RepID=A0A158D323_9BURK|nr:hypothetical protein [Caballeronia pedi]SAK88969.1 hypothetical protein AWB80_06216 [Caballeronia pedi]
MRSTIAICVGAVPFLYGCAVGGVSPSTSASLPLHPCGDLTSVNCIIDYDSAHVEELRPTSDLYPQLGLAMSGGGSKAAPFAMGVLKRFVDGPAGEQWIYKTDYLSSVSGSGYAAFYMYYKAYELAHGKYAYDPAFPGLQRFFVDSRRLNSNIDAPYFVDVRSQDLRGVNDVESVAESNDGCTRLSVQNYAEPDGHPPSPGVIDRHYANYQGWVECYQDLLMSKHSPVSTSQRDIGNLGGTFASMVTESVISLPLHYFSNLLFDWRKPLSPSQYDYLYGIERTYAYIPEPGTQLPVGPHEDRFRQMVKQFTFADLSTIYTGDEAATNATVGGYLPKWILQATGASGNVGVDLSRAPYDLATDVFEITFDEFGSGRYGYVRGSPELVGLTVPLSVLSSAAFADTAQRSLKYPRAAVNALLQGLNIRWGLDIPNYNQSNLSRVKHSFLIWPFYFLDDDVTTPKGPTIHLSDGGQSGDNLGMISLLRRSVQNIVVVAGENDWHRDEKSDGFISLSSLCSVNYYLVQHGYTMVFEADPRDPGTGPTTPFDLSQSCQWDDKHRSISIPNVTASSENPAKDTTNITPFNWRRRVWIADIVKLKHGATETLTLNHAGPDTAHTPPGLDSVKIYYLMSALDQKAWIKVVREWYQAAPDGTGRPVRKCQGVTTGQSDGLTYSCTLLEYVHDTMVSSVVGGEDGLSPEDRVIAEDSGKWVFPQNSTAFTTYSNSIYLFRAYRDLGWLYANDLLTADNRLATLLKRAPNRRPAGLDGIYRSRTIQASRP